MIDVVNNLIEITMSILRCRLSANPTWHQHPRIESSTDYSASFNQHFYLLVAVLTIMIDKRSAVIMTRPYMSVKMIHRLPECFITKMRSIENNIQSFHFFQQCQ